MITATERIAKLFILQGRNGEWYILSGKRGRPNGSGPRVEQTAKQLGLESTLRSRGRPAKE